MASIPLTLAALATSAVSELTVTGARGHSSSGGATHGDFVAVVLETDRGPLIVRVPRSSAAEVRQSAELLGLAALAEGARSRLPFEVPETLGMTRAGDSRAVVSTFVAGDRIETEDLAVDALLLQPIAEALAAVHELPITLVQHGGLPMRTSDDVRLLAVRLVDRAAATGLLPDTVHSRWLEALSSTTLWDFAPTVVHGSLDAEQLLVAEDRISGVLGWSELGTGDPAADLAWLFGAGPDTFDAVLARYSKLRSAGGTAQFRARARFHHELGVAKWLLHGVETHDTQVVDDAIAMLDRLVDRMANLTGPVPTRASLSDDEVSQLLDDLPEVQDVRSETAEYEALDEDRMFFADTDFIELPAEDSPDDAAGPDARAAEAGDAEAPDVTANDAEVPAPGAEADAAAENVTQPLEPLERTDGSGGGDGVDDNAEGDGADEDAEGAAPGGPATTAPGAVPGAASQSGRPGFLGRNRKRR